jgi:hypothetical protein
MANYNKINDQVFLDPCTKLQHDFVEFDRFITYSVYNLVSEKVLDVVEEVFIGLIDNIYWEMHKIRRR